MRALLLSVVFAASAIPAFAACEPATCYIAPHAKAAAVDAEEITTVLRSKENLPSISVAISVDGKLVWSRALGDADLETHARATRATKYRIGSVSKLVTAAAVMREVDAKRIDLDVPVQQYVPSFPAKDAPVTLRQILGHVAGIRHYGPGDKPHERNPFDPNHYATTTDALEIFSADPLLFAPGTRYLYSSYGYNLAGAALEGATKSSFPDVVRKSVTEPLAISDILIDDVDAIVPDRARPYRRARDGSFANSTSVDSCYKWPSGGLLGTPEALVRFAGAHATRDACGTDVRCGFLSDEALQQMFTSQQLADGAETGVGLGWRIAKLPDGRVVYHHGGLIEGGRAFVLVDPSRRIAVAIATNIEAKFGLDEAMAIADAFASVASR